MSRYKLAKSTIVFFQKGTAFANSSGLSNVLCMLFEIDFVLIVNKKHAWNSGKQWLTKVSKLKSLP